MKNTGDEIMPDLFEKRKRMEYLLNTLSDKRNIYPPTFKIPETKSGGNDFTFRNHRFEKK